MGVPGWDRPYPIGHTGGHADRHRYHFRVGGGIEHGYRDNLVHESWFLVGMKMDASGPEKAPFSLRDFETHVHTHTHNGKKFL